jgi:outer membrane receptor protein involved in Fe transport
MAQPEFITWPRGSLVAAVLAVCCCAGPHLAAQTQPAGEVTRDRKDATGAPLEAVTVTLQGAVGRVTHTGTNGHFAFQDLPEGEYLLTATRAGFCADDSEATCHRRRKINDPLTLALLLFETTTVTAAKTGERDVQATPMAVSVLSRNELQRSQAHTVADVAGRAPSVTFSQNSDFSQLTIRGIAANVVFAGSDPSSAVYLDGVYLARPVMALADFLDLERVEVLRGPQGTLYGRNAVGDALKLITRGPSNDVEASATLAAGEFSTFRAEARVGGPLARDKIMGNVAVQRGVSRAFVRDLDHPDHPLGGDDVRAARGKLRVVFNGSRRRRQNQRRRGPRPTRYRRISDRLYEPAGADRDSTWRPGYLERRGSHHPRRRGGERNRAQALVQIGGHLAWLDATYDRYMPSVSAGLPAMLPATG